MNAIRDISIILGTRPQILKSQPLINSLINHDFKLSIIHTGQHYDYKLSQSFFSDLKIKNPTVNLGIGNGTQLKQISRIITKLEDFFVKKKSDLVIIPGDTTSAIAGSIAASKCKIKIAHLEAGARSNQFYMSEEINRRMIDHSSNFLFAPTQNCLKNLKKESVFGEVFSTGDTMFDLFAEFNKKFNWINSGKSSDNKKFLLTLHRAENIENKNNFEKIIKFINSMTRQGIEVIFPVHPHTKKKIEEFKIKNKIQLVNPMSYFDLMRIMSECSLVITDSGGLQKEAYWMEKPCITLRESTEWVETIQEKANFLFPLSKPLSLKKAIRISKIKIKSKPKLFGNGKASLNIIKILSKL